MFKINENTFEQATIDWFKGEGYDYEFGGDIAPEMALKERESYREVVLVSRLKRALCRLNPDLPDRAIESAAQEIIRMEHPNLIIANKNVYELLAKGISVEVKEGDEQRGRLVKVFDFDNPLNNEFLVVNQFAIQGIERVRRPDVIIFVNGIPVAIFELKSPTTESGTIESAYQQLQDYKKDIPDLFKYNQIMAVSDLLKARHGTISSSWERFATWKGIESEDEKHPAGTSELELLIKGVFHKQRLMDIIRNFIVFEADSEKDTNTFTKKMCLYHQYFGVNKAIIHTLRAARPRGNKKIGVFWHTQGSGKSLSMVFYVNKAKELIDLKSPTFVFLTDRNDLDDQLYKTFLRTGYGALAKQADGVEGLKKKLRTAGGELLFSTIQKFSGENYEELSDRENIIIIADEAHRSQYAKFAGNVRMALPRASFMGITGTPISLENRDTRLVFGEHISEYPINRAVEDGATVKIFYEGRLVPLHLSNQFIDEEWNDLMAETQFAENEVMKRKFARLEQAVGSEDRLQKVAEDIIQHFNNRGLEGKGMIVTISRRVAVEMYKLISKMKNAPEVAVVISKTENFGEQIQDEKDPKELERRFKNPDDPLQLVIVCDMWLTGFDVPALHTMYIDKPLKNHTLMQAIARVNRVYKDKPGGLIVDYIGVADDLKKALSIYSSDVHKKAMFPIEELLNGMQEKYDVVCAMLNGVDYNNWKKKDASQVARLFQEAINMVISEGGGERINQEKKKRFLTEVELLSRLFALAMPHHEAIKIRSDVEFFQALKRAINKLTITNGPSPMPGSEIDTAIRELLSKSIAAEGVVDIFAMKDKTKPEISIFDEKFLEEVRNIKFKNVTIEILRKLLNDELRIRMRKNEIRYKSLVELLEQIIEQYENNIINSAKVIEQLLKLAEEIKTVEKVGEKLDLSEEEMAFYDALIMNGDGTKANGVLKQIVKELVKMIRRDLTIDWTNKENIKARIRADVRLFLLRNSYSQQDTEKYVERIYNQAFALYRDYIPAS